MLAMEQSLLVSLVLSTPGVPMEFFHLADPKRQAPTVCLLEDNAEALLKELTNPTGDPGQGFVEKAEVFSGTNGVKIVPMQRFHPGIPGWKYRITEKPKLGEYRYLRFAWKADGCNGIMIQFHDATGWNLRYTAGVDQMNWGTKFVADAPPDEWTVVTCDLFKDFGERTLQGIALTAFDGQAGYFDHIYFGRSIEELDRIDATGFRKRALPALTADELERLWKDLGGRDASKAYSAQWRLVAAPKQAVLFLKGKLTAVPAGPDVKVIREWIRDLDDDRFDVRRFAMKQLTEHQQVAVSHLEAVLKTNPVAEVRLRIESILAANGRSGSETERIQRAIRVLEYATTPEARKALEQLAKGIDEHQATDFAKIALKRLE